MRALVFTVLVVSLPLALVACRGDDDSDDTRPAECNLSATDLRAPTQSNRHCIRKTFSTEPARAAALLGELDWVNGKDTTKQLEALPVEDRWWYLVAIEPTAEPRVALSALQIARRTTDLVFAADIDLAMIDLATRANDDSTANTAIDRMLDNSSTLGAQKLQLLAMLDRRSDRKRIDVVCRKQNEAAIAWRCIALAPSLPESLAAIGRLPSLSFRDLDKLAPLEGKLVGLRCATRGARGIRSMFDRIDAEPSTPEEVTLYSRLSVDAPPDQHACFLEETARGCLWLVRHNRACPVLDGVARYVSVLPERDRRDVFAAVFEGKNTQYLLLYSERQAKQAGANLFHLHVLLGEMLVANNLFPTPTTAFEALYYHVIRAWRFWANVNEPSVSFIDMISPQLRAAFCADRTCRRSCELPWTGEPRDCPAACATVREKLSCP